jgi:hypothetical protein
MPASLDDILTTQKNGVVAINGLNQTLTSINANLPCLCTNLAALNVIMGDIQTAVEQIAINTALAVPSLMSSTVPAGNAGTQIVVGAGRLFAISIPTHSGGSQIRVYNSATTGGIAATNLIFQSLPSNTTGWQTYYTVNLAYTAGIVVATDASTTCAVSYTPNP